MTLRSYAGGSPRCRHDALNDFSQKVAEFSRFLKLDLFDHGVSGGGAASNQYNTIQRSPKPVCLTKKDKGTWVSDDTRRFPSIFQTHVMSRVLARVTRPGSYLDLPSNAPPIAVAHYSDASSGGGCSSRCGGAATTCTCGGESGSDVPPLRSAPPGCWFWFRFCGSWNRCACE